MRLDYPICVERCRVLVLWKTQVIADHGKSQSRMVLTLLWLPPLEDLMERRVGISNRESADAEDRERREHPPIDRESPPPQDAAGRVGELPMEDVPNRQTSHKAGSRSIAQKEEGARYPDRSAPPTHKVGGAFGKEPADVSVGNPNQEE